MDFDTESGHVLLLELAGQMALDEGSLQTEVNISIDGRCASASSRRGARGDDKRPVGYRERQTFPVPPSPTSTSLKVGTCCAAASAMVLMCEECGEVWY